MRAAQRRQWMAERAESDDEIDTVIAALVSVSDAETVRERIQAILRRKHGGSRPGRAPNVFLNHTEGHDRLWADYFSPQPIYPPSSFRRRFRMRKELFLHIHTKILQEHPYFRQRPDAVGRPGLSSYQKMTAALRILCYGNSADSVDEFVRIGESTAISAFKHFVFAIVTTFGDEFLRQPNEADIRKHMEINKNRGFVGMFGSLDCTHWVWKNCLVGHQGLYLAKDGESSMVLEAVATSDLWIWHSFVGVPGSNNDINVIDRSPLLINLLRGHMPDVQFMVNGNTYNHFYLLCDGIYPKYTIFVKTIADPQGAKRKHFAKRQESVCKDVERCFGVLQARFLQVKHASRWWSANTMIMIWKAAICLHNMIIQDEAIDESLNQDYLLETVTDWQPRERATLDFTRLGLHLAEINDAAKTDQLKTDLVEHLWDFRGDYEEE